MMQLNRGRHSTNVINDVKKRGKNEVDASHFSLQSVYIVRDKQVVRMDT